MKLKWLITSALALSTLFAASAFAADGSGFTDVDFSTEQGQAIEKMYDAGYLAGYNDGSFKPDATITRAELTRVFNQVFKYELDEEKANTIANFNDVEESAWYYNDVRIAQSNGYINGFEDNTFRPQDNFTRQQTCVVLALAAGIENNIADIIISDEVSPWAEAYVKATIADGAFKLENENTFRATVNITRGEVCQALAKYVTIEESSTAATTNSESKETTTKIGTDSKTETTTKVALSGSSGSSGSNGSSGSDGSYTVTTVTTTEATTETTTETTTKATTTETSTETTTETTTIVIELNAAQRNALDNVIRDTENKLVYRVDTDAQLEVVYYILDAMKTYRDDPSFDVSSAISEAKGMYNTLSAEEKSQFYQAAMLSYNMSDVGLLREIFGPLL